MCVYVFSLIITYMIFYTYIYIGGVTSMAPFLQKFFPSVYHKEALDKSTNQYCKFDSVTLTMFTSSGKASVQWIFSLDTARFRHMSKIQRGCTCGIIWCIMGDQ